jgi:hypothetical protein
MAHFAHKLHLTGWEMLDRVERAILLGFIGTGLAACVIGAAIYDIGRMFSIW